MPSPRRRLILALSLTGLILGGVAAPTAWAHTASFGSQHTLTFTHAESGGVFSGHVTSALALCGNARSVTLYLEGGGVPPNAAVATAVTNSEGAWFTQMSAPQAGSYYAVAAPTVLRQPGHKHTCPAATSNAVILLDSDGDGVPDPGDNCISTSNADQQDLDGDGQGNACDTDVDGDGFTVSDGDCDDTDPERHWGAPENRQDGVDNDCDGKVDEDFFDVNADVDGDGYTTNEGDCADWTAVFGPEMPELDDGFDNDCDGLYDEGFDADGDGFSSGLGDCDDTNPNVYPWAEEDLTNGLDDDCDGYVDLYPSWDTPIEPCEPGSVCTAAFAGRMAG